MEGTDEGMVDTILAMYREMVARKGFSPSESVERFKKLQSLLPDELKVRIMLCRCSGEMSAGIAWSDIGNMGVALVAASSNASARLGGPHLMAWKVVEKLKEKNAVCYNLNGIDPARNPGTYRFKKELAGSFGRDVCFLGKFDAGAGVLSQALIDLRDALRIWKMRGPR
jgi:lipid II:glycine glycyltransferase (peptidoglycan interpeptide bridge formation enzyme)